MVRRAFRVAAASIVALTLACAATVTCLAGAVADQKTMACTESMADHSGTVTIAHDCCAVEPPGSIPSGVATLQAAIAAPVAVASFVQAEPFHPPFVPSEGQDWGPRHSSALRSHLFDSVFRI